MKSFISLLFAAALVVASPINIAERDECGNTIVPFYRLYNSATGDHFYTDVASEAVSTASKDGYVLEGVAAGVFFNQQGTTLPLYRLWSSGAHDHFYTTDPVERDFYTTNNGYKWEGTAALVYTSQICGSVPLYRLYATTVKDHFYTTSATERATALGLGFVDQGIAGYMPVRGVVSGETVN
ncbi:hypothetical protein R3P38DRAFT_1293997 [Favolaschia claudopus]|uniref:DUF5648 domain-containing protein n=1 Tax=Favolaschia claudopus TaxID=2862362 RepID=A0AAW0AX39_9AGAR